MTERHYVAIAAQYQADVIAGTVEACRWVRLACERNRKDLDRQGSADFPYTFDPERGARICRMAEMLPHIKGPKAFIVGRDEDNRAIWNPIQLEPWQCWYLTTMFGWVNPQTGLRRFRVSMLLVPRKNAKSTIAAVVVLYMLTSDAESGAECYSAATTRDQAKVVAEIAWEMAKRSPSFCEYFGVRIGAKTTYTLTVPGTASKFAPLSADANTLDALNISFAVVDELHAHKTRGVWDVLDTATGARLQPLLLITTTAGVEMGGICAEKMSYLHKVLEGSADDEAFFGINYTVDAGPHTDKIEVDSALKELDQLCDCQCVLSTKIEQFWREACAKHATTHGTERLGPNAAPNIQTGRLKHGACATPAILSGSSKEIRPSRRERASQAENGDNGTGIESKRPIESTDLIQKISVGCSISDDSLSTESLLLNTSAWSNSKTGDVQFVTQRHNLYTWITATATALFGDCFARSATARSAFSETLRKTYSAHSPTCKVRKSSHLDGVTLSVERIDDDYRLASVHRKANPNYGVSVSPDDLIRKVNEAQHSNAAINNFLTKHLNVWVRSESGWMSYEVWQACKVLGLTWETLKTFPCWIGVDLGEVRDFSVVCLVFKTAPETFAVLPFIYVPEEAIAQNPIAQLSGWVHKGQVIETPGSEADYQRIEDDLFDWWRRLNVQEVDFDRRSARLMIQKFRQRMEETLGRDRAEVCVVDVPQSLETMDPAMKMTERLVAAKKLQHDGNEAMAWMVGNVVIERNQKDEIYPRKAGGKDSPNKIDGPVALFTALSRAMNEQPAPTYQLFTLSTR